MQHFIVGSHLRRLPPAQFHFHKECPVVSHRLGHAVKTIRLNELVVRLAENLASRYNVSVPQIIEALLVDCAEREMQGDAPPASALDQMHPMGGDGHVIDLNEARQRRRRRDAERFPKDHAESCDWRET